MTSYLAIIDVHFDKDHLPLILLGLRFEDRRHHLTRAAPRRCTSNTYITHTHTSIIKNTPLHPEFIMAILFCIHNGNIWFIRIFVTTIRTSEVHHNLLVYNTHTRVLSVFQ